MPVLDNVGLDVLYGIQTSDHKDPDLDEAQQRRLVGRYGREAPALISAATQSELAQIPGTGMSWAELRWAVRAEAVVHLDDLLLRRVRLGLLLPQGGQEILPTIRAICQTELGWDDARWEKEQENYIKLWKERYWLPTEPVPAWKSMLAEARTKADQASSVPAKKAIAPFIIVVGLLSMLLWFIKLRQRKQGHLKNIT